MECCCVVGVEGGCCWFVRDRVLECSSFGELTPGLEVGVGPTKRLWSFSGVVFTTTPFVVGAAAFAESVRFAIRLFRFGGGEPFSWSGTIGIEAFVTVPGGCRFCNVAGVRRLAVR